MAKKQKIIGPKEVLSRGWHGFVKGLTVLNEKQLKDALDLELAGKSRPSYIERIHQRYNVVRGERERKELAEKATEV
jgi:hypothetical protein